MATPHDAVDWSAGWDCGISWSYSLSFRFKDILIVYVVHITTYKKTYNIVLVYKLDLEESHLTNMNLYPIILEFANLS